MNPDGSIGLRRVGRLALRVQRWRAERQREEERLGSLGGVLEQAPLLRDDRLDVLARAPDTWGTLAHCLDKRAERARAADAGTTEPSAFPGQDRDATLALRAALTPRPHRPVTPPVRPERAPNSTASAVGGPARAALPAASRQRAVEWLDEALVRAGLGAEPVRARPVSAPGSDRRERSGPEASLPSLPATSAPPAAPRAGAGASPRQHISPARAAHLLELRLRHSPEASVGWQTPIASGSAEVQRAEVQPASSAGVVRREATGPRAKRGTAPSTTSGNHSGNHSGNRSGNDSGNDGAAATLSVPRRAERLEPDSGVPAPGGIDPSLPRRSRGVEPAAPPSEGLRGLFARLSNEGFIDAAANRPAEATSARPHGPSATRDAASTTSHTAGGVRHASENPRVATPLSEREAERRLGDRLSRLLRREARRRGIDLGEVDR